jgi:FkbM family methyltransferase
MRIKDLAKQSLKAIGLDVRFAARYDAETMQRRVLDGVSVRTVFDAGGFQGVLTAFYRSAFPNADVYAFEPFPDSADVFAARHGHDPKVHLTRAALGDAVGNRRFHVTTNLQHNSLLPVDPAAWAAGAGCADNEVRSVEVPVTTLDVFCKAHGIDRIDLLKMDLQGAEVEALRGAQGLLKEGAIDVIYSEVVTVPHYQGQAYFHEVTAEVHAHGYRLFGVYNMGLSAVGQMTTADAIYVSPAAQERFAKSLPRA